MKKTVALPLYTLAEAARELGRDVKTVKSYAAELGLGIATAEGDVILDARMVDRLRSYRRKPGPVSVKIDQ